MKQFASEKAMHGEDGQADQPLTGLVASKVVTIPPGGISLHEINRQGLVETLKLCDWIQADAADMLGISKRTMNYKVRAFGITPPEGRSWLGNSNRARSARRAGGR